MPVPQANRCPGLHGFLLFLAPRRPSPDNRSILLLGGALALAGLVSEARAYCGAAFRMVNTSWNVQGAWTEPGARFDLRFEYIDQDQLRAGSDKVVVGPIPQHHDEIHTINRNWLATFDYTFNAQWGMSATLPLIDRDHAHIHNHMGSQFLDTWDFTKRGDLRVVGRRQWQTESREAQRLNFFGVNFGRRATRPSGRCNREREPRTSCWAPTTRACWRRARRGSPTCWCSCR